jgi:hypothetical protein
MSLFGAKRQLNLKESLKRAKEKFEGEMASDSSTKDTSSGIGAILEQQLDRITGPLTVDGTATTSELAHECSQAQREEQQRQFYRTQEYEMLKAGEK